MKTILSIAAALILCGSTLIAQVKEPAFPTPNAASLGKYGDIPVSYHTGVPEISIPIYTIREGQLSVQISLSYHSSGIKVSETASWVGLGWSLNAGGMITRTVNGGPDEGITGLMQGAKSPYVGHGWYKNNGMLPEVIACGARPLSIEGPVTGVNPTWGGCRSIYFEAASGYIDTEPDLFTFNVNGQSGKFFFDSSRKIHMIPEADFLIQPLDDLFTSWKITGTDGTKYFFGGTSTEKSRPSTAGAGNIQTNTSTSWWLNRIESANGESWIQFEYETETYSFGNRGGHSVSFREFDVPSIDGAPPKAKGEVMGDIYNASTVISVSGNGRHLQCVNSDKRFSGGRKTLEKNNDELRLYNC
jgi:hypothetical protein